MVDDNIHYSDYSTFNFPILYSGNSDEEFWLQKQFSFMSTVHQKAQRRQKLLIKAKNQIVVMIKAWIPQILHTKIINY